MGKMKALAIDMMETGLSIDELMGIDEHQEDFTSNDLEEAHYVHTINDVVELMVVYGQLKVLMDITTKMQEVTK